MASDGTISIPDGGTMLPIAREVLFIPDRTASSPADTEDEATGYILTLHVSVE